MDNGGAAAEKKNTQVDMEIDLGVESAAPGTRTPNPLIADPWLSLVAVGPNFLVLQRIRCNCGCGW
jgi:hypothetical protein